MTHNAKGRLSLLVLGLVLTGLLCGLIWYVHRESPRTLVSFHGFVHAGIATRFVDPAEMQFPPENPFYAGEAICYYWFYQFLAGLLVRFLGWNVFHALEALSFLAIGILVFASLGLGRLLYRNTFAGAVICLLVLAGTNPGGAAIALFRIFRRGNEVLTDSGQLWGVVGPIYTLIGYPEGTGLYGPFLNFFLNITARPLALALLIALVYFLDQVWRERDLKYRIGLLGVSFALAAINPMIGIAVTGTFLPCLLLCTWWQAKQNATAATELRGSYLRVSISLLGGILLACPTFYHLLLGPSERGMQLWLGSPGFLKHVAAVGLGVLPLLALAVAGLWFLVGYRRPLALALLGAAVLLLLPCVILQYPASNESNFFHAAGTLLAVSAAGVILSKKGDGLVRWRVLALVVVFVPTPILMLESYLRRPPVPVEFARPLPSRIPADSPLAQLYQWVQSETPQNAIFVLDTRGERVTAGGNISEFPAMTQRVLFTESKGHYLVAPYADSGRRSELAAKLHAGEHLDPSERAFLHAFDRPFYVVSYQPDTLKPAALNELGGRLVFSATGVAVYKVDP